MNMNHRTTSQEAPVSGQQEAENAAPKHTPMPKLVMGHLEVVTGADMESSIPYDDAVIHLEGDEDSEIEVHCPGALRLAPLIVKAVNNHDALVKALEDARLQLEYVQEKHGYATGETVLARVRAALSAAR